MRTLFALLFLWSCSAFGQTVKDVKVTHKRLGAGDSAVYVPSEANSFQFYDAHKHVGLAPLDTFATAADLQAVDAARISGDDALNQMILDEENARIAADAGKAALVHTHVSADITNATSGAGGGIAGRVVLFNTAGGLYGITNSTATGVEGSSDSGTGVYAVSTSGDGLHASSTTGMGAHILSAGSDPAALINNQSTGYGLQVVQNGGAFSDIARFTDGADGLTIDSEGGLVWDDTDGRTVTRTSLLINNVENTALSTWAGSTNITTLGTISTGTWGATAIGATRGGTAQTSWTLGDMLFSDATNSLTKLPGNTTAVRQFLTQTGNGSVSAAPTWRAIAASDVPTLNQNTTGSAATWTTGRTITLTGDATGTSGAFDGSGNLSFATTLANTAVAAGSYQGADITVDSKGRLTAASSGMQKVLLGSDRTNSTTSFADATGLSFTLEANTTYAFTFRVLVTTPATTQGYNIAINGPTTPTAFAYQSLQPLSNTTQSPNHQTAYDTGTAGSTAPAGTFVVVIPGTITTGASGGTLIVRFLSETGGQTVTVKAGSNGELTVFQ